MPPTYQIGLITLSLLDSAEGHKPPVEKHSICCREPSVGEVHILLFGSGVINTTECTKKNQPTTLHLTYCHPQTSLLHVLSKS